MEELYEWLDANKITFSKVESDVIEIEGFGKVFCQDVSEINSIFRQDRDGELEFNLLEDKSALQHENIQYVTFKFGNNWYFFNLETGYALNILKYVGVKRECVNKTPIVNLGVHTGFELLNGSFMPKDWVRKAKFCGHTAIGICDANTMAAHYNLQKECKAAGIKPVFGYTLSFKDEEDNVVEAKVYVQSQNGLRGLLRIQKAIMVDSEDKTIPLSELKKWASGNVLVFGKLSSNWILSHWVEVDQLKEAFDKVFFQVDMSEYKAERIDVLRLEALFEYYNFIYPRISPILLSDAYYLDASDYKNKLILNKVATGAAHEQSAEQYYKDADEHYAYFQQLFSEKWDIDAVFKECAENAMSVADGAVAEFENTRNFMPKYDMTPAEKEKYGTPHNMFCQLLEEGLQRLIPEEKQEQYRKQMEYEKYIIESTDNVDYLLVQYDTCNWARENNILVGCGRGSAAGSLLLYLLGITLIDPIKYDLIFERFLLPERAGLYPAQTTIIGQDIETENYLQIELENGKVLNIDRDAQLIVKRADAEEPVVIYCDELQEGDDILFDNRDLLFTIPEL